jgi:SAM-dependent methyltransferase
LTVGHGGMELGQVFSPWCAAPGSECRRCRLVSVAMMDAPFVAATRDSYDALADEHAEVVASGMDDRPLDRALFAAFAELVRAGGNGPVADVGCGPGRVTILLSSLGLDAFGIDLSPGMLALARRSCPQLSGGIALNS